MSGKGGGRGGGGGRGAFYKAKYGGKRTHAQRDSDTESMNKDKRSLPTRTRRKKSWPDLIKDLASLDRAGYGSYNRLCNADYEHEEPSFAVTFDSVQADAYAPPSKVRVIMPLATAAYPAAYIEDPVLSTALRDFITRRIAETIRSNRMDETLKGSGWSGPKGGAFNVNAPGQEVLDRTSCVISRQSETIEARLTVSLPARGRSILAQEALTILTERLPTLVKQTMPYKSLNAAELEYHVNTVLCQHSMRSQLKQRNLVSFVANSAILPRQSGAANFPMKEDGMVAFESPPELEVTLETPKYGRITGMGIPTGVTVLTGGGFHGKSTLLEAIQVGVYDHIPGDGRDGVVTDPTAFKVRAEDGRSVTKLDISPFISALPHGKSCETFTTKDASGSTSMAATIQEALELGSKLLLIDEDSSATNLLVRDQRMQALIKTEPIKPFVCKAGALYKQHGVSTIIVVGGCGDYLSVADTVIGMEGYRPHDLTGEARSIVKRFPTAIEKVKEYGRIPQRPIQVPAEVLGPRTPMNKGQDFIRVFESQQNPVNNPAQQEVGIDLRALEQIVEPGQAAMAAQVLVLLKQMSPTNMGTLMDELEAAVVKDGLDALNGEGRIVGNLVALRRQELGAVINRLRGLQVQK